MIKIVVADDEPLHLDVVEAMLERAGYSVITVGDGKTCLKYLQNNDVDLVITDIFMQGSDGFGLISAIKEQGIKAPIVAMTGGFKGDIASYQEIMVKLGALAVLSKPFTQEQLLTTVNMALKT